MKGVQSVLVVLLWATICMRGKRFVVGLCVYVCVCVCVCVYIYLFVYETGSHVAQDGLEITVYPRMSLDARSFGVWTPWVSAQPLEFSCSI